MLSQRAPEEGMRRAFSRGSGFAQGANDKEDTGDDQWYAQTLAEVVVHALFSIDLYHLEEFNHKSESEYGERKGAKEQAFFFQAPF